MASATAASLNTSLTSLIAAMEAHPVYQQQQACRNGKVFFMCDFVKNTRRMLESGENNQDVLERCLFQNILINDTTGKLTLMTGGDTTQFGDGIKAAGRDCSAKAENWGRELNLLRA